MMDDVKHTRGPWGESGETVLVRGISWLGFANYENPMASANGRLIKAAPDMLAEMQRYLPIIEHIERNPNFWREASRGTGIATANGYRAAIAKATGGV